MAGRHPCRGLKQAQSTSSYPSTTEVTVKVAFHKWKSRGVSSSSAAASTSEVNNFAVGRRSRPHSEFGSGATNHTGQDSLPTTPPKLPLHSGVRALDVARAVPSRPHTIGMTRPDTDPDDSAPSPAAIVDADGLPVVSVQALLARLMICDSPGDLARVCNVLSVLTGAGVVAAQHQSAIAEWARRIDGYALSDVLPSMASHDHPVLSEANHLQAIQATQQPIRRPMP